MSEADKAQGASGAIGPAFSYLGMLHGLTDDFVRDSHRAVPFLTFVNMDAPARVNSSTQVFSLFATDQIMACKMALINIMGAVLPYDLDFVVDLQDSAFTNMRKAMTRTLTGLSTAHAYCAIGLLLYVVSAKKPNEINYETAAKRRMIRYLTSKDLADLMGNEKEAGVFPPSRGFMGNYHSLMDTQPHLLAATFRLLRQVAMTSAALPLMAWAKSAFIHLVNQSIYHLCPEVALHNSLIAEQSAWNKIAVLLNQFPAEEQPYVRILYPDHAHILSRRTVEAHITLAAYLAAKTEERWTKLIKTDLPPALIREMKAWSQQLKPSNVPSADDILFGA